MKILNPRVGHLSNSEVLAHITAVKAKSTTMKSENLETVLKEVKEYLLTTPCATQSPEKIENCLRELGPYGLEKAEILMLINERPTGVAELDCVVEEMEGRFGEEEVAGILDVVKRTLA